MIPVELDSLSAISAEEYLKIFNQTRILFRRSMPHEVIFRDKVFKFNRRPEFWTNLEKWEEETWPVLDKYLGPGKTFLDIGSWNGVLSLYAEKLGAKCFAFEPDDVAYAELTENIRLNDSKIKAYNLAVSSRSGYVHLYNESEEAFGNSMSSMSNYKAAEGSSIHIQSALATTLDDIAFIVRPDLIKMDIESAEAVVLSHSVTALQIFNCPMWLTVHPQILDETVLTNLYFLLERLYDFDMALPEFLTNEKGLLLTPIKKDQ